LSSIKVLFEATFSLNYPPQVTREKIIQVTKLATGVTEIPSLEEEENWLTRNFKFLRRL
jgi:hypothetical protein